MERIHRGFTLIELLVVVAIIALLIAIMVPSLGRVRQRSQATVCLANLKGIATGLMVYQTSNDGYVVPSYNMSTTAGGTNDPLDGWAPILDRDGMVVGRRARGSNIFYCPSTLDIEGMKDGQTGSDRDKPKGWMDWPNVRTGTANLPVTIPDRGFEKIIRVTYWINADNPIGGSVPIVPNLFYTSSVGYGPVNGQYMRLTKATVFKRPASLIMLADGVYAGRQRDARVNTDNSRIGYRHPDITANIALADGHCESIKGTAFPRAVGGTVTAEQARIDNSGPFMVYADPARTLGP